MAPDTPPKSDAVPPPDAVPLDVLDVLAALFHGCQMSTMISTIARGMAIFAQVGNPFYHSTTTHAPS